ncbi:Belongs to the CD36, partial [Homalodisca vitripennis]
FLRVPMAERSKTLDFGSELEIARSDPVCDRLYFALVMSLLFAVISVMSFVWTPYDLLMNERLKMVRGLPAYEWWANPPDEVLLRVYLFNITNAEEFLQDPNIKLQMEEVGPYIFREKLRHTDVKFNENGTMTYTAHRTAIFLPELNHLSLNASLTLPNLAVLGMSSYLWDASFFTKLGFNLLQNRLDSQPLMNTTVYNYFWNLSDPLLKVAHQMVPSIVPVQNMGILHQIYNDFVDEVTVYMGPENGYRFFTVNQFHGSPRFGYWDNETCDSVQGATEGVTYHQSIAKTDTLKYLRKTICRVTPLHFDRELLKMGMKAYRFELPSDIFSRPSDNATEECFLSPGLPSLPSGLTDVSPCYYNFPIAASFPHFLNAERSVLESIDGLTPSKEKHGSFVIVEPFIILTVDIQRMRFATRVATTHPPSGTPPLLLANPKNSPAPQSLTDILVLLVVVETARIYLPTVLLRVCLSELLTTL